MLDSIPFVYFSVFLPFFGFVLSFLFANRLGSEGISRFTTTCLFFSFLSSVFLFYVTVFHVYSSYTPLFTWISYGPFFSSIGFFVDSLSALMVFMVTSISFVVHLYSIEYMANDPHRGRFMIYLSMFTFFMLLLVTAPNLMQLFLGWEGIGLCSYLLIGFWFTRPAAVQSAFKAVLVNRVGDLGLMVAMALLIGFFGTSDFLVLIPLISDCSTISVSLFGFSINFLTLVSFFLIIAAVGKSAQIGLHTWLPDAMEGPTPVSALIHAATLVTAGVFLLVRMSFLLEFSEFALTLISFLGVMTALLGATIGLFQYDIKRVIAYSTCSQLGYMFYACGGSNYDLAMYHLFNHAYFKALLFLGAGSVIHALADEQDIRRMGGLARVLPFTCVAMTLATLSLCGFPGFSGFYSKDLIIESSFYSFNHASTFVYWVGLFATFCSSFYSFRLLYLVFFAPSSAYKIVLARASEPSLPMSIPLFVLVFPSIFSGYLFSELLSAIGSEFWYHSVFIHFDHFRRIEAEFLFFYFKLGALVASFFGAFFSIILHRFFPSYLYIFAFSPGLFRHIFVFLNKRWCFDPIYNWFFTRRFLVFSYQTILNSFDRGVLELLGPRFSQMFTGILARDVSISQSGFLYRYIVFFVFGFILLLTITFFPNPVLVFFELYAVPFVSMLLYPLFEKGYALLHREQLLDREVPLVSETDVSKINQRKNQKLINPKNVVLLFFYFNIFF